MPIFDFKPLTCVATLLLVLASSYANATPTGGNFINDDDRYTDTFTLTQPSHLLATTLSWAQGGFAPVLALFDGSSLLQLDIGSHHVCADGIGGRDNAHGFCWDAQIDVALNAGDYTLILSQDFNLPNGQQPDDGYERDGEHNYTSLFNRVTGAKFIAVTASQRSSAWAFDLNVTPLQRVTEPAPAALLVLALVTLLWTRRQWVAVDG